MRLSIRDSPTGAISLALRESYCPLPDPQSKSAFCSCFSKLTPSPIYRAPPRHRDLRVGARYPSDRSDARRLRHDLQRPRRHCRDALNQVQCRADGGHDRVPVGHLYEHVVQREYRASAKPFCLLATAAGPEIVPTTGGSSPPRLQRLQRT